MSEVDVQDEGVTLQELVEMHNELETEAKVVLGAESPNVCTYPEGYKPRQPIFACLDCSEKSNPAGICYGCSVNCHDNHNVVELYTKRNFCCDCGNSKFSKPCKLYEKSGVNFRNKYDHNFEGLYCVCNQPYPNEDNDDEMFQCGICEDWFHLNHLIDSVETVNMELVEEVICRSCVERLKFINFYSDANYGDESNIENAPCRLEILRQKTTESGDLSSLFFKSYRWRERLCRCKNCENMYEDLDVEFLTDITDSAQDYGIENAKRESTSVSQSDAHFDRKLIETTGRDAAIAIFAGYEAMKTKIFELVKRKADEGKIVNKKDIEDVFNELNSERKRIRLDTDL